MSVQPAVPAPVAEPDWEKVEQGTGTSTGELENKKEELAISGEEKKAEDPTAAVAAAPLPASEPAPEPTEKKVEPSEEKKVEEASVAVASAPVPTLDGLTTTTATTTTAAAAASGPTWPETSADHPLTKFFDAVPELLKEAGHDEVYGITLAADNAFLTKLILQKYLRANANDVAKAKEQLLETLKWRREFQPQKAAEEKFDKERFEGLGYILELEDVPGSANTKDVVTFNIYGAVKDNKKTFGDLEGFLRWRVGLMERSVQKLNLSDAKEAIPDYGQGPDPYQGFQIHDYLQVSFLRMDPDAKAASKKTIEILGRCYPETLSRKFFVNVPVIMQWLYGAMKLFVAKETQKKFSVLSYGNQLATELGPGVPKEYGGTKGELKEIGETLPVAE